MPNPPPPPTKTPTATTSPPTAFRKIATGPGPIKTVLYTVEGWGKTTAMAHAPNPVVIMSPQESGFITLRRAGRVPDVPCTVCDTWTDVLTLLRQPLEFDTVCFDALGGFEQLAREHVLQRDFGGDITKYNSYGKGDVSLNAEWMTMLTALERISHDRSVILAGHAKTVRAKDPSTDDYDRWACDLSPKTWEPTKRWADAVLFGRFFTVVDEGKGKGGTERVVYTEHRDTHDAKNRFNMPAMVKISNKPDSVYSEIFSHINKESK